MKWIRSLGTSKQVQGVATPPAPQNKERRRMYFLDKAPWWIKLWRKLFTIFKRKVLT